MSGGMTSTTFKIMSYTLNTSRTTVNEGESIVFTADLSNAKRYDPNTPHPTWGWLGHFVPFKAGDVDASVTDPSIDSKSSHFTPSALAGFSIERNSSDQPG